MSNPWHDLDPKTKRFFDGVFNAVAFSLLLVVIVLWAVAGGA